MNKRAMPKGSEADSMKQGWSEKRILAVTALLCEEMERAASLDVRLSAEATRGENWYDAKG